MRLVNQEYKFMPIVVFGSVVFFAVDDPKTTDS